ncbi:MAG: M23 family metallopeptidase [Bacillaceae bacterium]|nr:M23 family metallopeptidase [Bacillaceae bacterium]
MSFKKWIGYLVKGILVSLLILLGIFIIYDQQQATPVPEIRFPAAWVTEYIETGEKYGIPWYHLAAYHEVQDKYLDLNREKIEQAARHLTEAAGGRDIERFLEETTDPAFIKMREVANGYRWAAASLDQPYVFPFLSEDRPHIAYEDTWGASRSFGGNRTHEGTDLMADHGTPLVSVCDGIVIRKGWNRLGGWAVTILDLDHPQMSYYYAHLSRYADDLHIGKRVKAGELIGYVGDSGYGDVGTTGQFPPHLHFGIYVRESWLSLESEAVNPYPFLKMWDTASDIR